MKINTAQDFTLYLIKFLSEPGLIRTCNFTFDVCNGFTCKVTEGDSQPEFYKSTFKEYTTFSRDMFVSFELAIKGMRIR